MQFNTEPIANRGWGSVLLFGILSIILGILFIAMPKDSLKIVVVISGIFAIIIGLANTFEAMNELGDKKLKLLQAVLQVVLAIVMVAIPFINIDILMYVMAAYMIVFGICALFGMDIPNTPIGGFAKIFGIVTIILGILIAVFTGPAEDVIMIITGIFLIICGASALVGAIQIRSAVQTLQ